MNEVILYNYYRSSTSFRVRIALHWKEIPFKYEPIHLLKNGGEQHSEAYRKLNPMGEVPTLIHNIDGEQRVLGQTMPILEYLEENFPQRPLLLKDPVKRAKIRQFCENINSFIHPLGNLKVLQWLEANHKFDQAAKEAWVQHWTGKGLVVLEQMIATANTECAVTDHLSLADIFLAPQVFTARRFKVNLDPYPRILKLEEKYKTMDAFQKAHPFNQPDTPPEEKI